MISFTKKAPVAAPDYAELLGAVVQLTTLVRTLRTEVQALQSARDTTPVVISTVGPVPASPAEIKSGRSGMRYIALMIGGKANEDTIRKALVNSPMFAQVRSMAPDVCTNVPLMRWLAGTHNGETRFSLIHSGRFSAQQLWEAGK